MIGKERAPFYLVFSRTAGFIGVNKAGEVDGIAGANGIAGTAAGIDGPV